MANVKPIPEGYATLTPHLVVKDIEKSVEFYKKAFGAAEMMRVPGSRGRIMHACVQIGDSQVMLVDEMPEWNALGPKSLKNSPVTIHLQVADADATFERAVKLGATVLMPIEDAFWGDRYGKIEDPFGHHWSIATHVRDVSPEELAAAAKKFCG